MPLYEYIDERGRTMELFKPVEQRDLVPEGWRRISVPRRVALFGTGNDLKEPSGAEAAVPRALKALDNGTVNQMVKHSGFSVDKFKEVWGL